MLDPRRCHRASILRHGPLRDADGQGARYGSSASHRSCYILLCPCSSVRASQLLVSHRKRTRRVVYAASVARAVEGGGFPSFEAAGKG